MLHVPCLQVMDDWRFIGQVVDRLLFIIFFITIFCGALTTFINAPNIFERIDEHHVKANHSVNFS